MEVAVTKPNHHPYLAQKSQFKSSNRLTKQLGTALRMSSADMDLAWQQAAGL